MKNHCKIETLFILALIVSTGDCKPVVGVPLTGDWPTEAGELRVCAQINDEVVHEVHPKTDYISIYPSDRAGNLEITAWFSNNESRYGAGSKVKQLQGGTEEWKEPLQINKYKTEYFGKSEWKSPRQIVQIGVIHAVWSADINNAWVAGDSGSILHWDGTVWTKEVSPTTQAIRGLWGSSPCDVWAAADDATILHRICSENVGHWVTESYHPFNISGNLFHVWVQSDDSNMVWFVGDNGTILLRNNGNLINCSTGSDQALRGVWGTAYDGIWVVGKEGNFGTILHGNCNSWTAMPQSTPDHLIKIWGSSKDDIWIVGEFGSILHRTAAESSGSRSHSAWERLPDDKVPVNSCMENTPSHRCHLTGIWGSGKQNVWAVGGGATFLRWNATDAVWNSISVPLPTYFEDINGSGACNGWASGGFLDANRNLKGTILGYMP